MAYFSSYAVGGHWISDYAQTALGFASITKQSFIPAVAVGLVVLLVHPVSKKRSRFPRLGFDIGVLLAAFVSAMVSIVVLLQHLPVR